MEVNGNIGKQAAFYFGGMYFDGHSEFMKTFFEMVENNHATKEDLLLVMEEATAQLVVSGKGTNLIFDSNESCLGGSRKSYYVVPKYDSRYFFLPYKPQSSTLTSHSALSFFLSFIRFSTVFGNKAGETRSISKSARTVL